MCRTNQRPRERLNGYQWACRNRRTTLALTGATIAVCLSMSPFRLLANEPEGSSEPLKLVLDADVLSQHVTRPEMFAELPEPADVGLQQLGAFEENHRFVYLVGTSGRRVAEPVDGNANASSKLAPLLRRRVFILKPSILVMEDQVIADAEVLWGITSRRAPLEISERHLAGVADHERFHCRSLFPDAATWKSNEESGQKQLAFHRAVAQRRGHGVRLVHVMSFGRHAPALPECSLSQQEQDLLLQMEVLDELTRVRRVVELTLPRGDGSGRVRIIGSDGFVEVAPRRLPDGILPLGNRGVALREQWDVPYRHKGLATWDTGRPSSELMRLVENGNINPCRTVELGCGTGNDAIYLAKKGFEVTAIDISPAALDIAERKAAAAGVEIRWLLADVLRPPELGTFDLVYDRGCYHEVRQHHSRDYVGAIKSLTRAGSRGLILAGKADKDSYWRFSGPPRVTEEQIRSDFARGFDVLHLREFRFDPTPPDSQGALAWSVLLERRAGDSHGDSAP